MKSIRMHTPMANFIVQHYTELSYQSQEKKRLYRLREISIIDIGERQGRFAFYEIVLDFNGWIRIMNSLEV